MQIFQIGMLRWSVEDFHKLADGDYKWMYQQAINMTQLGCAGEMFFFCGFWMELQEWMVDGLGHLMLWDFVVNSIC